MKLVGTILLTLVLAIGGLAAVESAIGVDSGVAMAAEAAAGQRTLWDNIVAGGWVEGVQIVLSIIGLALVFEHAVSIRRDRLLPRFLLSELEAMLEEEDYDRALELCETDDSMISRIMGAALTKIDTGFERMMETAIETADQETTALNQKISYINLLAVLEPMLGLLGTVLGMIGAFSTIAQMAGLAQPSDLADSISQAMVTTATGLIVAIPLTAAYTLFRNRILRISQDAVIIAGELLERFRTI